PANTDSGEAGPLSHTVDPRAAACLFGVIAIGAEGAWVGGAAGGLIGATAGCAIGAVGGPQAVSVVALGGLGALAGAPFAVMLDLSAKLGATVGWLVGNAAGLGL